MKKLLIKLTAVILSLTVCLGFFGCTQEPPKTAKVSNLIENAITNILSEEHVNLAITAQQISDGESATSTSTLNAKLFLKNNDGAYDVIANLNVSNKIQYKSSIKADDVSDQEYGLYRIGNEMVNWQKKDDEIVYGRVSQITPININQLFEGTELNKADLVKIIKLALTVTYADEEVTEKDGSYTIITQIDLAKHFNDLKNFVVGKQDETLAQIILERTGKTQAEIEQAIDKVCVEGLTVSTFIDKLNQLNTELTGETKTIKETFDKYQTSSGLSTAEIVDLLKKIVPKDSSFADYLTAPTENQTIYDYFLAKVAEQPIDALIKEFIDEDMTLADLAPIIKKYLFGDAQSEFPGLKVKDVIDYISYALDFDGAEELISQIEKMDLTGSKVNFTLKVDVNGKLTNVDLSYAIKVNITQNNTTKTVTNYSAALAAALTYGAPDGIAFAIPESAR